MGREHAAGGDRPCFLRRHLRRPSALSLWLLLIGGYGLYAWRIGLSPGEAAHGLIRYMAGGTAGALLYVGLYVLRPLVLFPASVLAVAAGFVFGPLLGVLLTFVGCNASATVSYLAGRLFGRGALNPEDPDRPAGKMTDLAERLRAHGFETVLTVQFVYLPFDLVNYPAGFLRVGWGRFALATLLGTLPGTVSFVPLGSSVSMDMSTGTMGLNPWGPPSVGRRVRRQHRGLQVPQTTRGREGGRWSETGPIAGRPGYRGLCRPRSPASARR